MLVHGTGPEMVPPDFPVLSAGEVRRALSRVPRLAAHAAYARVVWHSPRPYSSTAIVSLAGAKSFPRATSGRAKQVRPSRARFPAGSPFVVVKRYPASARSTASLSSEHAFIAHLASCGLPVPNVLDDGVSSAWQDGGFIYEVQDVLPGDDLYSEAPSWAPYMSEAHALSAGAALARLHLASASYARPARPVEPLSASARVVSCENPLAATEELACLLPGLEQYLRARPRWKAELERALAPFHSAFLPYAGELSPLWSHNDWHPSNLLWAPGALPRKTGSNKPASQGKAARATNRDGPSSPGVRAKTTGESEESPGTQATGMVAGIIDFSLANLTSAVYDLATAIERSVVTWLLAPAQWRADLGQAGALVQGYCSVRPLPLNEARALPHLLPLVHVDYALSEVDYFVRVARSQANADVAWQTYLLGHLRWWATPRGRRLLAYVTGLLADLTAL